MAIRTKKAKIVFCVIFRITITMINLKSHRTRYGVYLIPSTKRTLFSILFHQVTLKVSGDIFRMHTTTSADLILLPRLYVVLILMKRLTFI